VVLAARSLAGVTQATDELRRSGFLAEGLACDTASQEQVEALADRAVTKFGRLDIWVNNAGIGAPYGPTAAIASDRFLRVVDTNIKGVYLGSMAAMNRFLPQKSGKLINLIGRGAEGPVPFQNAYASSKIWVRSFSQSLAREYKDSGVGVYLFNPGLVITDMLLDVEAVAGFDRKMQPLNTVIRMWGNLPPVPAQKAVWLASSATDGKTGLEVNVLTPQRILKGVVQELARKITRRPGTTQTIQVTAIPAVVPVEPQVPSRSNR
jgi:NAD(P)-dependent dehydrogenase (short-subunit alcohol dehydrogenase family)